MNRSIRVLLVVQNELHRRDLEALCSRLTRLIHLTEVVRCLEAFESALSSFTGDLLLLDDDLSEDVFSVIREIRQIAPDIPIVLMSSIVHPRFIEMVFQSGVYGFVYREEALDTAVPAVLQTVMMGMRYASPLATNAMIAYRAENTPIDLNETDWRVLRLIDNGENMKAIAKALNLNQRSIYRTRGKLEKILGALSHEHLIAAAREQGLLGRKRNGHPRQ